MRLLTTIFAFIVTITLVSCSTSNNMSTSSSSSDNNENKYVRVDQLANHINTLPRLTVRGDNVINTTANTIEGTPNPLFVIDGVQMGRDFGQILQVLDQNKEVIVEFLSSSRATTRYGEEGRNGVIIIKTQ